MCIGQSVEECERVRVFFWFSVWNSICNFRSFKLDSHGYLEPSAWCGMVCAFRVPANCFMLFGFSCNICCFGSYSTNANSTNFLKTEPMRLPHFVCMAVCSGDSKKEIEIERESAMQSRSAPYFAAMEVIFKMHYRFISCCYLQCNLKCIQASTHTLIPSRLCLSFSDIMMYVGLVTFNVFGLFQ